MKKLSLIIFGAALAVLVAVGIWFTSQTRPQYTIGQVQPEMVVIPAGSFQMGSPSSEFGRFIEEEPLHRVTISQPFAMGKYEVTFAQWDACVAEGGCNHRPDDEGWGRGNRPVINVSWNDITEQYLPWLNKKAGKRYRLPSEAEWEYAARAGTRTAYWWGDYIICSQAAYGFKDCKRRNTEPVGNYLANTFGLYDVHGNVFEWTEDCWNDYYSGAPTDGSAWIRSDCDSRVLRSGSGGNSPRFLRSAFRYFKEPSYHYQNIGFRLARTL